MQKFLSAKLIAIGALVACDTTDGTSIRTLSSAGDAVVTATEQTGNSDFGAAVDTATSLFTFTNNERIQKRDGRDFCLRRCNFQLNCGRGAERSGFPDC